MASAAYQATAFFGGEWSKQAQGRMERQDYRTALNVCFNGLMTETGAWTRRPGTLFAGITLGGHAGRLINFDIKYSTPLMMEFTDGDLRFWSGATLVTGNDDKLILSISAASPAVVETTTAHGWTSGDTVFIPQLNLGTSWVKLQNRQFAITVIDATHFSLIDPVDGTNIDGAAIGTPPIFNATIKRARRIATVYTGTSWSTLRSVQAEQNAVLLNPNVKPYMLVATITAAFPTFVLSAASLLDGPYLDPVAGSYLTPSATTGSITFDTGGAAITGFVAADIGRIVRFFSQPPQWDASHAYTGGEVVSSFSDPVYNPTATAYYQANGASTGNAPALTPTKWVLVTGVAQWTWGTITAVNSPSQFVATLNGSDLLYVARINLWRLGVYGGVNNVWPTCGTYSDGRIWLTGAVPNRVDSSVSNGLSGVTINMAPTATDGTVLASSGISYTLNSDGVNPAFWMEPDLQGILVGTQVGEWLIQAPTAGPITPFNITARRVTKIGCANIAPKRTEHTLVFVQRFGRKIIEYFADVFSGKFAAPDLTERSKHTTIGGIQELAYQQELAPIVWARVNGQLRGWNYKRDSLMSSQGPTYAGAHRHALGSGRTVESIATGISVNGQTDTLYMVTSDAQGVRHVEILTDIPDQDVPLVNAYQLDDAVTPSSTALFASTGSAPYGGLTLNGLWHLNGQVVTAFLGGLDCGDYTVAQGSIDVPFGDGVSAGSGSGLFTQNHVASFAGGMPMIVGFPFTSDGQMVRPNTPAETGARSGPALGMKRRTNQISVLLDGTQGISFGTSFDRLRPALFRTDGGTDYTVLQVFSGVLGQLPIEDATSFDSMLCWRITRPYPATIAAIEAYLHTADKV